jgi:hypothetical protein
MGVSEELTYMDSVRLRRGYVIETRDDSKQKHGVLVHSRI